MKQLSACLALLLLLGAGPGFAQDDALDLTFGAMGQISVGLRLGGNDNGSSTARLPVGRFLVAGSSYNGTTFDFSLARFLPDGAPDYSFGNNGKIVTAVSGSTDRAQLVIIQPDGKILVVGFVYYNTNNDFLLVRYLPDGSLDTSFGNQGIAIDFNDDYSDMALAAALLPDGKILVGGESRYLDSSTSDFLLARYLPDGTLDSSFASNGKMFMDF